MKKYSLPIAALLAAGAVVFAPPAASAAVPALVWTDCGDGLQCADARVPLDYDAPNGPKIGLALARRPATDPAHRLGSLFVNNGGPGNSVVDFVAGDATSVVPPAVQARFDIVGFDPRGVGRSTPIRCFDSTAEQQAFFADRPAFPVGLPQTLAYTKGSKELAARCGANSLAAHVSTANVARDLDLLRRAVGDAQLTYAGYSYGGLLGVAYANLFPDKVRALLLDGTPSPQQWTSANKTLPVTVRIDSAPATGRALDAFLDSCQSAGVPQCAFAAPDTRAKFDALMGRLRTGPITVQTPDGPVTVTYAFLVDALRGALQFPPIWPFVAEQLQAAWTTSGPAFLTRTTSGSAVRFSIRATQTLVDEYDNSREALLSVLCGESANPPIPALWPGYAAIADARTPYFGADWTYLSQPCATWPIRDQDHFTGRYDRKTANPVLFVNGTQDAASDLAQARAAAAAMPGARLLVVDGPGHPASFLPDACLQAATTAYLVDRQLPAANAVCTPDLVPFNS